MRPIRVSNYSGQLQRLLVALLMLAPSAGVGAEPPGDALGQAIHEPPPAATESVDGDPDPTSQPHEIPPAERPADQPDDDEATSVPTEDAGGLVDMPSSEDEQYFELLKVFADTLDQVERNYVQPISRRELIEAAIDGLLSKLDEYSDYITPDEIDAFRTGIDNEFSGIGIRVGRMEGQLTIITPLFGSPAHQAGILAGDRVLQIDGQATDGMTLQQAIQRMKGPIDSAITLTVRHAHDGSVQDIRIVRQLIAMETVLGVRRGPEQRWEYMLDEQQKIGYVRITAFSRQTPEDLRKAVQQLVDRGLKGLVLDLRFNPGGLLSSAVAVADLFVSEGVIVSTEGRNVRPRVWTASAEGTFEGFPIAVLVNTFSASASEIVAACLQDHQRAVVIGERTWGKGSVQNVIELEGGRSALKITTAGYHRPSGKNIDRFPGATEQDDWGVRPNEGFEVSMNPVQKRQLLVYQQSLDILAGPRQTADDRPDQANESEPPAAVQPDSEVAGQAAPQPFVDMQLEKAVEYLNRQVAQR